MKIPLKFPRIPENIPEELHKNFKILVGIDLFCLVVHCYMLFLFQQLGILFMQRFNYFSIAWFALLLVFLFRNKRNQWFCASYAIMGEVIVHQTLAVIFIGVNSGFQYFMLVSAVCFTYFPEKRRYRFIRLGLSTLALLSFVWLSLRGRDHMPLYRIPEERLTALFIMCCTLSLGTISTIMYASYRSNERAFQELRKKNRQILSASESKANFLANMSHEIRTPMNAILGMTDLILSEQISQSVREKIENIYSASRSLLTIINDILDFSKIESGKMEIIESEYRLSFILSDLYFLMAPKAETKAIRLKVQVDGNVPDCLIGDEIRLKQVMMNLISNAVKYTEKGTVTIRVSARPTEAGINLKLSVEDTGIGIRPADLDKLFSSFTQVNTRQNRTIEGTGLGLAISKQLITLMGGFTNVESEYGKGSVFSFVLPQAVADAAPMVFDSEKHHAIEDIRTKNIRVYNFIAKEAKILVVDDVDMNLKVACGLLAPYQMQIETVLSGKACMEKLKTSPDYDIVFMDHMMPGLDGVDTTKLIRAEEGEYFKRLPIVALTANALTEVKSVLMEAGMDDFIVKPIDMHDMYRVLLRWLPAEKINYIHNGQDKTTEPVEDVREYSSLSLALPGVDVERGIAFSGGEAQYKEFLSIYYETAGEILTRLRSSVSAGDWHQYEIDAHALKSTSAGVGADHLSGLAQSLEKAAREDHIFVREATPELLDKAESLLRAIQTVLPAGPPDQEEVPGVPAAELIPDLERLAESIGEFMPDASVLNALVRKGCINFPEYAECMRSIQEAVKRFDYDSAFGQTETLLSNMRGGGA